MSQPKQSGSRGSEKSRTPRPATARSEVITHEKGNDEAWVCVCKNTPCGGGFFPCDEAGNEMDPIAGWKDLYVCADCGRIIDQRTLQIVGRNPNAVLLK